MFLNIYFIDYAITVVPIFPLLPPSTWYPSFPQQFPLSSCPWAMHISSLASLLPLLFLTTPLSILYLPIMLLNLCTFSLILPIPLPR